MYALVVDDDPTIAEMVATVLMLEGFETRQVGDGESALAQVQERRPDVVLLDIMMPGLDGLSVLRALRGDEDEDLARVPVVIVSAKNADSDVWEGWREGADSYVSKPFDPQMLAEEVLRTVQHARETSGTGR